MKRKLVMTIIAFLMIGCCITISYIKIQSDIIHTAPVGYATTTRTTYNTPVTPEQMVKGISGNKPIVASFLNEPDYKTIGTQNVTILLTDCHGNTSTVTSYLNISPVLKNVTLEATNKNDTLHPDIFLCDPELSATFSTDQLNIDLSKVGNYNVYLNCQGSPYVSKLTIVDTTPPKITTRDLTVWPYTTLTPTSFVRICEDTSNVTYEFETKPSFTYAGRQEISLICTDDYGNTTTATAYLTIRKDTEPPVLQGVRDKEVTIGDTISYKQGVSATDNSACEVAIKINSAQVNLSKEGAYEAIYTATDKAGNVTIKTITVTVVKVSDYAEKVDELTDQILARIINDSMTDVEKLDAIFHYVLRSISYIGYSSKEDWVQGAYQAFTKKQGDCFTYYAAARALLTKAGFANMEVQRIGNTHFWNLVNLNNSWYHFDASPKSTRFKCFMLSDADVAAYGPSIGRPEYYDFDTSLYPSTPEKSLQ